MPVDALDPTWIDAPAGVGPTYNSEELRRDLGFLLAGGASPDVSRTGVLDPRALTVTLSGSNVQINPGGCAIGTGKGAYLSGASVTATVDVLVAADVTNPRRDRVVLEILDPDNGGAAGRKAQFRVIAGTPSATAASGGGYPPAPTSPSITLAYVDVPKSGNGAPVVTDLRPFTATAGAVIYAPTQAARDTLAQYAGLTVWRPDLGLFETSNGTGWISTGAGFRIFVPGTASGTLAAAASVNLAGTFTVPANVFGPGIPYEIQVDAQAITSEPAGVTVTLEALLDLAVMDGGRNQKSTPTQTAVAISGSRVVTDGAAKTVTVKATATAGTVTFVAGTQISYYRVKVTPIRSF